jgi:hypothetical protein
MDYIDIRDWDKCKHPDYNPDKGLPANTKLVLALDCSKNDDSTALVGIVTEGMFAGMITLFGIWEKPRHLKGDVAESWQVPRDEVDARIREVFNLYKVQGFWADPSHKYDSEGGGSYWVPLLNQLHKDFGHKIPYSMWAKGTEHSILWDMASHANQRAFVDSVAAFETEVTDKTIRHDGSADLRRHFRNARRFKSKRFGETIAKESPRSPKKVDAAVTAIIAYTLFTKLGTHRRTPAVQSQTRTYSVPGKR